MKKLPFIILALAIVIRALFSNINAAEWGDSYRILRAAEFVRNYQYPSDEKRAPLFSVILAARPSQVDPVVWGRTEMLVITALLLIVFTYYTRYFIENPIYRSLSVVLLCFNPVFFYWSLRIMADVPFLLIVLCAFYLLKHWEGPGKLTWKKSFLLGVLGSLGVLIRFEGYILLCALLIGIVFLDRGLFSWADAISQQKTVKKSSGSAVGAVKSKISAVCVHSKNISAFVFSQLKLFFKLMLERKSNILAFIFAQLLILGPYWYYRNPLASSYFEEPSGRSYDFNTVMIYVASLLFISGFVPFFSYIFFRPGAEDAGDEIATAVNVKNQTKSAFFVNEILANAKKNLQDVFSIGNANLGVSAFVLAELLLVLIWPAALPRIFTPILPFLVILLTINLQKGIECLSFAGTKNIKLTLFFISSQLFLIILYAALQYKYRLQFLLPVRDVFIFMLVLQVALVFLQFIKNKSLFLLLLAFVVFGWSVATVNLHKDIFMVVRQANVYAITNLKGAVGYNDVSSVSDWYLNQSGLNKYISGKFFDLTIKSNREYDVLQESGFDYFLVTNEHNTDLTIDLSSWPHLKIIKSFSSEINGKTFFTHIIEFKK